MTLIIKGEYLIGHVSSPLFSEELISALKSCLVPLKTHRESLESFTGVPFKLGDFENNRNSLDECIKNVLEKLIAIRFSDNN